MGFRSSLVLFYPGRPPRVTDALLRRFAEEIRGSLGLTDQSLRVGLHVGEPTERAFDAKHELKWNRAGTLAKMPSQWEHEPPFMEHTKVGKTWSRLWPQRTEQTLHAASLCLGSLPKASIAELGANDPNDPGSYCAPDKVLLSLEPFTPYTLRTEPPEDDEADENCHGCLILWFSGNGYFQWQPLEKYWASARQTRTVTEALRLCRRHFPVPAKLTAPKLAQALGDEPFLNRSEYSAGDWVVSLTESG